jgi:hypothetical protein
MHGDALNTIPANDLPIAIVILGAASLEQTRLVAIIAEDGGFPLKLKPPDPAAAPPRSIGTGLVRPRLDRL